MRFSRGLACAAWLAAAGCARKAPGPDECRTFADRVLGVARRSDRSNPRMRVRVEELTRSCLVTPYDRKLLRCVELGAPLAACKREFDARSAARRGP